MLRLRTLGLSVVPSFVKVESNSGRSGNSQDTAGNFRGSMITGMLHTFYHYHSNLKCGVQIIFIFICLLWRSQSLPASSWWQPSLWKASSFLSLASMRRERDKMRLLLPTTTTYLVRDTNTNNTNQSFYFYFYKSLHFHFTLSEFQ